MATLRHKRGYAFERYLVKEINDWQWDSRILGGASTGLPDVVATNNDKSVLFSIEAKSTVGNKTNVPQDEFIRCMKILDWLSIYKFKYIILAFKFGSGKVKEGKDRRKKGDEKRFYFLIGSAFNVHNLKYIYANDQGKIWWTLEEKGKDETCLFYEMFTSLNELKNPSESLT